MSDPAKLRLVDYRLEGCWEDSRKYADRLVLILEDRDLNRFEVELNWDEPLTHSIWQDLEGVALANLSGC